MSEPRLGRVVVVGRPNVGKSSLVNRIVGRRAAVVEERPGVTRDAKTMTAEWTGKRFSIVDTGGWLPGGGALDEKVSQQAQRAWNEADVILLVIDVTVGITEEDMAVVRQARRAKAPVLLVANKVDDVSRESLVWDGVRLGLGDPWPVSALHGRGTGDLLDEVVRLLPETNDDAVEVFGDLGEAPQDGEAIRVALVGRPNVGKSTLFNRLVGDDLSIVHDMPGTTRDAVDTILETEQGPVRFIDTAGMRRRARTDAGVDTYATLRALEALDRADVCILVIDATVGATHQDQRLAERIGSAGCSAVVALNKWDLIGTEDRDDVLAGVADRLAFLGMAPVLKISASSGRGVHKILPALFSAIDSYHSRVSTGALNRALREIQSAHPAPGARIRYGVQGAIDPPTFTLFTSGRLPLTYLRYIERGLRERFEFGAAPLKIRVRTQGR
jgi:GTP-binding protein